MKNRSMALGIDICPRANVSTTATTNTTCKMGTKLQKNAPSRRSGIVRRPATVNETNAPKASATNIGLCSDNRNPPLSGPATSCRYVTRGRNIIRTSSDQPLVIDVEAGQTEVAVVIDRKSAARYYTGSSHCTNNELKQ